MAIVPFLAMVAVEMRNISALPPKTAWMACHFSPYGPGLSNLPRTLPPGALLILDDVTPPHRHDPTLVAEQLSECVETLQCCGILLDFQRKGCAETKAIAKHLAEALPCPVVLSDSYAEDLDCPVFLPSVPPSVPPEVYLSPWQSREIWLEISLEGEILTLTEQGCERAPLPCPDPDATGFFDETLHCHYSIETNETSARFTLWRTKEDVLELLEDVESLGIASAVGLYQELHRNAKTAPDFSRAVLSTNKEGFN